MDWRYFGGKVLREFTWLLGLPGLYRPVEPSAVREAFLARCRLLPHPRVLELGAKRSLAARSTLHRDWVPHAREYLGTDIEPGQDVDIVADLHRLTDVVGHEAFDVIISCSTFEHLKYPHLAAHQVLQALKVGGLLCLETHQSFPLHAYPHDYFRFSREALEGLFGTRMGFKVVGTSYHYPVNLHTPAAAWAVWVNPAYLNVTLFGEKVGPTPADYVYELAGA